MPKVSPLKLSSNLKNRFIKQFWFAVSETNDIVVVEDFFKKILTPTETVMLAKRLEILKYLLQGSSYEQIRNDLKVTDSTISRLSNILHEDDPQFLKVLGNLTKREKERWEKEIKQREHPYRASKKVWP